jgi:hypothetical protein
VCHAEFMNIFYWINIHVHTSFVAFASGVKQVAMEYAGFSRQISIYFLHHKDHNIWFQSPSVTMAYRTQAVDCPMLSI